MPVVVAGIGGIEVGHHYMGRGPAAHVIGHARTVRAQLNAERIREKNPSSWGATSSLRSAA